MKYISICSGIEAATTAWHALGNSMAVPCMAWLGWRIHTATVGDI
jgi:site-specific DNA-cytosine methylase